MRKISWGLVIAGLLAALGPVTATASTAPVITSIRVDGTASSVSGPVGSVIDIFGSGFTTATANDISFDQFTFFDQSSPDGKFLQIFAPAQIYKNCRPALKLTDSSTCTAGAPVDTQAGQHSISVNNLNGTSNSVTFTTTSGASVSSSSNAISIDQLTTSGYGNTYTLSQMQSQLKSSYPWLPGQGSLTIPGGINLEHDVEAYSSDGIWYLHAHATAATSYTITTSPSGQGFLVAMGLGQTSFEATGPDSYSSIVGQVAAGGAFLNVNPSDGNPSKNLYLYSTTGVFNNGNPSPGVYYFNIKVSQYGSNDNGAEVGSGNYNSPTVEANETYIMPVYNSSGIRPFTTFPAGSSPASNAPTNPQSSILAINTPGGATKNQYGTVLFPPIVPGGSLTFSGSCQTATSGASCLPNSNVQMQISSGNPILTSQLSVNGTPLSMTVPVNIPTDYNGNFNVNLAVGNQTPPGNYLVILAFGHSTNGVADVSGTNFEFVVQVQPGQSTVKVTSVSPSAIVPNSAVPLTIIGSGFSATGNTVYLDPTGNASLCPAADQTINFSGVQMSCLIQLASNAASGNGTSIQALVTAAPWSPFTGHLLVSNSNGTSNDTVAISVGSANSTAPLLQAIQPNSGPAGTKVTLTGNNFTKGTTINLGSLAPITNAQLATTTAQFVVPAGTPAGTYNVFISNGSGNSVALPFTVTATGQAASSPVINTFTASPNTVASGQETNLSWNVTGATSLSLDNGVGNLTGQTSVTVSPTQTTTYTLTATNSNGSVSAQTTVAVSPTASPSGGNPTIGNNTTSPRVGDVVYNPNSQTVFLVGQTGLYGFTNAATFYAWGYTFSQVQAENSAEQGLPQLGTVPMPKILCPTPLLQIAGNCGSLDTASSIRTGLVVSNPNSQTIYLVGQTGLYGFPNAATFYAWGYTFLQVSKANSAEQALSQVGQVPMPQAGCNAALDQIAGSCGSSQAARIGQVVYNPKSQTVYLVGQTGLYGFPNAATFYAWGYKFSQVLLENSVEQALSQVGQVANPEPVCAGPINQINNPDSCSPSSN